MQDHLPAMIAKSRVVQTELDQHTYDQLRDLADRRGRPLQVVMRSAIVDYIERGRGDISNDPILNLIGSSIADRDDWSERKDWSEREDRSERKDQSS